MSTGKRDMVSDLFLIAHKVHGLPAFDVATQMTCPECSEGDDCEGCPECDGTGLWWIIPTSGHRAYPWWQAEIIDDGINIGLEWTDRPESPPPMPPSLPDHYPHHSAPTISLAEALGIRPKPTPPIIRRF